MLFKVEWLIAGFGTLNALDLGLAMIPLSGKPSRYNEAGGKS